MYDILLPHWPHVRRHFSHDRSNRSSSAFFSKYLRNLKKNSTGDRHKYGQMSIMRKVSRFLRTIFSSHMAACGGRHNMETDVAQYGDRCGTIWRQMWHNMETCAHSKEQCLCYKHDYRKILGSFLPKQDLLIATALSFQTAHRSNTAPLILWNDSIMKWSHFGTIVEKVEPLSIPTLWVHFTGRMGKSFRYLF